MCERERERERELGAESTELVVSGDAERGTQAGKCSQRVSQSIIDVGARLCFAAKRCSVDLETLNFASASCAGDRIAIGDTCTHECKAGYYSAATTMTCQANSEKTSAAGTWNTPGCAGAWFYVRVFSCGKVGRRARLYFHRGAVLDALAIR